MVQRIASALAEPPQASMGAGPWVGRSHPLQLHFLPQKQFAL